MHNMNIKLPILLLLLFSPISYAHQDFTDSFNQLVSDACNSSVSRTVHLQHGNYYFRTPPKSINCSLTLEGEGIGSTNLIRSYQGNTFLYWVRGNDHSGGALKNLTLLADENTNKGIAVIIEATEDETNLDNSFNRHSFIINNVTIGRIAGANTSWDHGIYLDGSKNPDGRRGFAPGIRMTMISNTTISGTNVSQIYLNKARGPNIQADCFIPLGSFHGIMIDNATQGVKIDSRSCPFKVLDGSSNTIMENGIYKK